MGRQYFIFVPDTNIDEQKLGYSGVVEWCCKNLSHPNIFLLTLEDVYLLQYHSKVLEIINEENNSTLQEGEDDWIFDQEIKKRILQKLINYKPIMKSERENEIIQYLKKLLNISIDTKKSLYFIF